MTTFGTIKPQLFFVLLFLGHSFRFPSRGITDVVFLEGMLNLTAVTVCLWVKSSDTNKGHFIGYALPGTDNQLSLGHYKNLKISI